MIKSSTLNFVRQKADEAKQLAELHASLTDINNRDREIKAQEAALASLKSQHTAAAANLKTVQEATLVRNNELRGATALLEQAKRDAASVVAKAEQKAKEVADGVQHELQNLHQLWDERVVSKIKEHDALVSDIETLQKKGAALAFDHSALQKKHDELVQKHADLVGKLNAMKSSL